MCRLHTEPSNIFPVNNNCKSEEESKKIIAFSSGLKLLREGDRSLLSVSSLSIAHGINDNPPSCLLFSLLNTLL